MTKLELAISYDVEHDLFHPQNVFTDEYVTPTFVEYVKELEKRCANYEMTISKMEKGICDICKETEKDKKIAELEYQLTHRNCVDCSNHSSKLKMRTLELEKENAELKTQIEKLKGYEYIIQKIKDSGFETFMSVKTFLREHEELEKENARLKEQLKIAESNADSYYDKLAELQEQTMKNTNIGVSCSTCYWNQYDEDEVCYNCCGLDKWKLNKTLFKGD